MDTIDKAKDTIRKLLNLANDDSAAEGEIDNALRFARRLMLHHDLTEADVTAPRDPHEIAADEDYAQGATWTEGAKLSGWEGSLMNVISSLVGTVGSYYSSGPQAARTDHGTILYDEKGRPKKATKLTFYGPAADVRDAIALFDEWKTTIAAMARMKFGGVFRGPGRSYCEGFVVGMRKNVAQIEAEERALIAGPEAQTETALVLVRNLTIIQAKREKADEFLREECGINLGSARRSGGGTYHADAFGAGKRDGSRASVTRTQTKRLGSGS